MSEKKEKDKTKATEADSSGAADIIKAGTGGKREQF